MGHTLGTRSADAPSLSIRQLRSFLVVAEELHFDEQQRVYT